MSDQLQLDLAAEALPELVDVEVDKTLTLREQWQQFHALNPELYRAIVRIARQLKGLGFRRCSIALIFERLRWVHAVQTRGDSDFVINNNWRAHYARELMDREPDLAGFFEVRRLRSRGCEEPPPET